MQVDCLADRATALRGALEGAAQLAGVGTGWGAAAAPVETLSRARVVLARSLHELSPGVLSHLRGVPAVLLLSPWDGDSEEALGAELGVRAVVRVAPPTAEERADTVLALLLALMRRTHALSRAVVRGAWLPPSGAYRGARRCAGAHLALVGLDASTAGVARRAAAFGLRIAYVHPVTQDGAEPDVGADAQALTHAVEAEGAVRAPSLLQLLAGADAVSVHCCELAPGVPAIGEAQLARLPHGACLVHTAPPNAVDTGALKRALCSGALGGAAVDAPDGDSWLEAWARDAPNLIITPRASRNSEEAYAEAADAAAAAVLDALRLGPASPTAAA